MEKTDRRQVSKKKTLLVLLVAAAAMAGCIRAYALYSAASQTKAGQS